MSGPQRLSALLSRWQPARGAESGDPSGAVAAAWAEVVGPDVARRTRPGRIREGTLSVFTAGSTWSHQLTFLASGIVAALLERCPQSGVRRLRFVVATGRTKALLDGLAAPATNSARGSSAQRLDDQGRLPETFVDDPIEIVLRLRRRQDTLDRRREREGWMRCDECGSWRPPAHGHDRACAVCADEERRAADNRIERVVANAPWLRRTDVASHVPDADDAGYDRVRRRLLARWEEQMSTARRRLRRGELQAADRVVAWSYLMLLSGLQQHLIGRAVVADVLGKEWTDALVGPATGREREATATAREKLSKTNARVYTRRDHT